MAAIGVDPAGIAIMQDKGAFLAIKTYPISAAAANILKQQMLAVGGECAVAKEVATCQIESAPAILLGTRRQYQRLIDELSQQYFGLKTLSQDLKVFLERIPGPMSISIGDRILNLAERTYVMGILNVTPDSFFDGGKFVDLELALERALQLEAEGADIIDIGGESTRPGSIAISVQEELQRVIPVVEKLRTKTKVLISVDTYKAEVAKRALKAGAQIINDISGLRFDPGMAKVIAESGAAVILMHIQGTPRHMQDNPQYDNLIDEILDYLRKSSAIAMQAGIRADQIIIDPGIGFGKRLEDNYVILKYLDEFKSLGFPILVGPSRKSFIGKVLDLPPEERLEGTLAAVSAAVLHGANIVRVHDVQATVRAVRIIDRIKRGA
jgi:dihydropteroate synthase